MTLAEPQDVYDYQMSASPIYHANSRVDWGDTNLDAVGWTAFLEHTVGIYNRCPAMEYCWSALACCRAYSICRDQLSDMLKFF